MNRDATLSLHPALLLGIVIALIYGLVCLGAAAYLRRHRQKGAPYLLLFTVFAVYFYFVLHFTLFQFQSLLLLKVFVPDLMLLGQDEGAALNLIPLLTLNSGDLKTSLLNVLLLVPFGLGLPFLLHARLGRVILLGGLVSLGIEILQFTTGLLAHLTFRIADVNDLILNTLGAAMGYGLFLVFQPLLVRVFPHCEELRRIR